jgi:hypothetical protein
MESEAFHAAAGLLHERSRSIAFLFVHCEIVEVMSTANTTAIQIPVREFLQACQLTNNK